MSSGFKIAFADDEVPTDEALHSLKKREPKAVLAVLETIEDYEWMDGAQYDAAMDVSQTVRDLLGLEPAKDPSDDQHT